MKKKKRGGPPWTYTIAALLVFVIYFLCWYGNVSFELAWIVFGITVSIMMYFRANYGLLTQHDKLKAELKERQEPAP